MKKTVLITGASSGFGRLTARKFQQEGWNVIATMRSPEKETELNALSNVLVTRLDVTDSTTIQQAIQEGLKEFGSIDALINNAGFGAIGYLEEASEEDVKKQMDTNFTGVVNTIREVLPQMRRQNSGTIVNVTSLAGSVGMPMLSLYNASKFAVEGLSESLKFELEQFGIDVKTVAPGAFKTGFGNAMSFAEGNKKADLDTQRERFKENFEAILAKPPKPFGYGNPQDVADLIYRCTTSKTPNKNLVGKDAKMTMRMRRLMSKRSFANMLKNAVMPK
ncbi:SDR family oxidoreductase [Leptobacterium flavescens]|nr:SDR family oxidoreductase [Leptobacterium flavescens]